MSIAFHCMLFITEQVLLSSSTMCLGQTHNHIFRREARRRTKDGHRANEHVLRVNIVANLLERAPELLVGAAGRRMVANEGTAVARGGRMRLAGGAVMRMAFPLLEVRSIKHLPAHGAPLQ